LRLTEQRQYPYVIKFLNAAIEFHVVVTEEKREMNCLRKLEKGLYYIFEDDSSTCCTTYDINVLFNVSCSYCKIISIFRKGFTNHHDMREKNHLLHHSNVTLS